MDENGGLALACAFVVLIDKQSILPALHLRQLLGGRDGVANTCKYRGLA